MSSKKIGIIIFFILLLSSLIICQPLLKPGLFTMHDDQQVARLFVFDKALKEGQFPVRIVDDLGFNLGYPLFIFYPPAVYMFGEIFHFIGFSFINSIKIVFMASVLFSALAMYICSKEFYGRLAATVSSIFYILVPYKALDMYVRGALAESVAFIWPPLIIWSFYKLKKTNEYKYVLTSAIFLSLLAITHNLILISFLIILPIYLLFLISLNKQKLNFIWKIVQSLILSAGLSAFFWLPSLLEKKYTLVDQLLLTNLADFKIHFVYLQQLWNWPWGYGGSAPGLADGISFKIGKLHIIVSTISILIGIFLIIRTKPRKTLFKLIIIYPLFFGFLLLVSTFMTTNYSEIIWNTVKPLDYLQFPWRYLMIIAVFTSLLSGSLIFQLRLKILKVFVSILLIASLLYTNLKLFKPQTYRPNYTDNIATSYEVVAWSVSSTSFEYLPKETSIHQIQNGGFMPDMSKPEINYPLINVLKGKATISNMSKTSSQMHFNANVENDSTMQVRKANFPGWQVKIDGQKVSVEDNNSLKMITFNVDNGIHEIEINFSNTPIILLANIVSLLSLLIILSTYFIYARRR